MSGNSDSQKQASFTSTRRTSFTRKKKKFTVDIKNMGVNIDKNEYYEIKLSNSAFPERGL